MIKRCQQARPIAMHCPGVCEDVGKAWNAHQHISPPGEHMTIESCECRRMRGQHSNCSVRLLCWFILSFSIHTIFSAAPRTLSEVTILLENVLSWLWSLGHPHNSSELDLLLLRLAFVAPNVQFATQTALYVLAFLRRTTQPPYPLPRGHLSVEPIWRLLLQNYIVQKFLRIFLFDERNNWTK